MQYYKIVKPYPGFEVGQVISVASPERFADMQAGYGIPADDPNIVKPKTDEKKVEKVLEKATVEIVDEVVDKVEIEAEVVIEKEPEVKPVETKRAVSRKATQKPKKTE